MALPRKKKEGKTGFGRGALLLVLALPTACASYAPAPISPETSAAALEARRLDDPRLRQFITAERGKPPGASWGLADLTLAALYYHPDLAVARARLGEAEAAVVTAGEIPNPQLSFEDLAYNLHTGAPVVAPIISFVIETAGKRHYRSKEARALVDAARADLETASWQVRGGVRSALLDLWAAESAGGLLRQRLAVQDELVELLEHRLAAGAVSALDLARERIARNQMSLALSDAERRRVDALTALAAAIGVPREALDGVAFSFVDIASPAPPALDRGKLRREALFRRSDVQALLADYAAAESALALAVANQYPNLTLGPGYGYDAGQNVYILPAADLPVFNQNQGPIAEARARRRATAARFSALQAKIINAVDGAAADYRAATDAVTAADTLLAGATARAQRVQRSFAAGQVDRPTWLTAEIERLAAEQSRLAAALQQRQALGALEDAVQQPLYDPGAKLSPPPAPDSPS
jgi:cobalt-zinc-cadmium efflux system outer membrane protein